MGSCRPPALMPQAPPPASLPPSLGAGTVPGRPQPSPLTFRQSWGCVSTSGYCTWGELRSGPGHAEPHPPCLVGAHPAVGRPAPPGGCSPCRGQAGLSALACGTGPLASGASTGSRGRSRGRLAPSSAPGCQGGSGWRPTAPQCLWPQARAESAVHVGHRAWHLVRDHGDRPGPHVPFARGSQAGSGCVHPPACSHRVEPRVGSPLAPSERPPHRTGCPQRARALDPSRASAGGLQDGGVGGAGTHLCPPSWIRLSPPASHSSRLPPGPQAPQGTCRLQRGRSGSAQHRGWQTSPAGGTGLSQGLTIPLSPPGRQRAAPSLTSRHRQGSSWL